MPNLIQYKSALEERLNKHGSRMYNLENLNIPQKVSKAVDEIVTDVKTGSYKTHEDHKNLYEALEKSMDRNHSNQLQVDLAEARKKCRKRSDSPRTPFGSPPPPPSPPSPSPRASSALEVSGASRSSQLLPPPPSSSSKPADSDKSK
ncbi:retrovirus-related pol polyprotein from transposon TNT 1-94 [Tanacetum coccineum]